MHAVTSERRAALGIAPGVRFYEESTYWNPSWTLPAGAIQTTNIYDMTATAVAIGEGTLLSRESHQAQVEPALIGFGAPLAGCPSCHTLDEQYSYGLGVALSGSWILQNPLFGGYGAVETYLPAKKLAVAVATTYGEQSFDAQGNYRYGNASQPADPRRDRCSLGAGRSSPRSVRRREMTSIRRDEPDSYTRSFGGSLAVAPFCIQIPARPRP